MNSKEYREWRRSVDLYPEEGAFDCYVLGLCSEAGEVAGKLKKEYRDDVDKTEEIRDELSDVIWYLDAAAEEMGMTLEELMQFNYEKIEGRKKRGTIQGSGDGR